VHSTAALCVHDLAQATLVLQRAKTLHRRVMLVSGEAAGVYAGCLWWRSLVDAACAATGGACDDLLDCADQAGQAMAALRVGCRAVLVDAGLPALPALRGAATMCGATIWVVRPECLDLADSGAARRIDQWIGP
jgi:hypothetical protein